MAFADAEVVPTAAAAAAAAVDDDGAVLSTTKDEDRLTLSFRRGFGGSADALPPAPGSDSGMTVEMALRRQRNYLSKRKRQRGLQIIGAIEGGNIKFRSWCVGSHVKLLSIARNIVQ